MKKNLFIFFFIPFFIFSQEDKYKPKYNPFVKDSFKNVLKERYNKLVKSLDSKHKSKLKKQFKERDKTILNFIEDSTFLFQKEYDVFIDNILKEVKTANPNLNTKNYKFFFNRHPFPNAACYGNDVFMLNTGLFHFLESEDEFAYIVCHEIAHQVLNHVNKSINRYVNKVNSKEVKKKIKQVQLTIYGRNKAGMNLLKDLTFNFLKHSRAVELEADSLGYEIFKKTKYNSYAAITALKKLKESDEALFETKIKLDSLLNFKEYPFKKYWLDKEESMFNIKEKVDDYSWNKDSLKSHPNIEMRIKKLKSNISKPQSKILNNGFKNIKDFAKYQQIGTLLDFNHIDIAFYFLLKDLQTEKPNKLSFVKFSSTLKKLYQLKLEHKLGKHVQHTSPFTSEKNLNEIRQLLHNLELKEIKNIGFYFCLKYEATLKENKEFIESKNFFQTLKNKK